MERLLLLWDELDEYVGWGRYIAAGFVDSMQRRKLAIKRRLRALAPASSQA
jgi:hypothetical protein